MKNVTKLKFAEDRVELTRINFSGISGTKCLKQTKELQQNGNGRKTFAVYILFFGIFRMLLSYICFWKDFCTLDSVYTKIEDFLNTCYFPEILSLELFFN